MHVEGWERGTKRKQRKIKIKKVKDNKKR
jgi:hypothetical protein